jgi:hypothetical protein
MYNARREKVRKEYGMAKTKGVISGHAPGYLRDEVLKLIEDKELLSDKSKADRLYNLLGKLWNCTDKLPSGRYRDIVADCLEPYCSKDFTDDIRPADLTYAMMARNFRPSLKIFLDLKKGY